MTLLLGGDEVGGFTEGRGRGGLRSRGGGGVEEERLRGSGSGNPLAAGGSDGLEAPAAGDATKPTTRA